MRNFKRFTGAISLVFAIVNTAWTAEKQATDQGVSITYQLPADGPLPATYLVTLAVTDPKNPDWIVCQFVRGAARTVTAENKGQFTDTWDGLDDNHMPVPPGEYSLKGIYSRSHKWEVDGEWHAVTPQFVTGASAFMPPANKAQMPEPFRGDPCGAPLSDVAVGQNGIAVFYYQYLENGLNNPMFDLNKPGVGHEQFIRAFNSGGAGGGECVATDGETVWAFSTDGGPKYVYRADGKSFGSSPGANRANSYLPKGWVTAMAVWRDGKKPYVYVAQRGAIETSSKNGYLESQTQFVNKITVNDGDNGAVVAELPITRPQALAVLQNTLYALQIQNGKFQVVESRINAGLPEPTWNVVFEVPAMIAPADLEVDSHARFYLSDSHANKVYQLSRDGKITLTFGRMDAQKPGAYDRETFITPGKLAVWTDAQGNDRLIVVEKSGPNRVSEWSADGKLLREFLTLQTKANDGYAIDPEHPDHIYVPGQNGWLTRFIVNYESAEWRVDAVWPNVGDDPRTAGFGKPLAIRVNGRLYLASGKDTTIYRVDGDRCILSAAIIRKDKDHLYYWNDANGNGVVDDDEMRPAQCPPSIFAYHGQNFGADLSMLVIEQGGKSVWRLPPAEFDSHGNPVFKEWQRLFNDPIFEARAAGKADAIHGGNELAETYSSDWCQVDGLPSEGFFVQARGGKNFSANDGAQYKVSYYAPDVKGGGYKLRWRTGRSALGGTAQSGEFYGAMRLHRPINGLLSVVDQSRCGVLLFNLDGLYVDTVFPDGRRFSPQTAGMYSLPGEFFSGSIFENRNNGKIYFALGKYTPLLFEAIGWTIKDNPVQVLKTLPGSVSISASQIANVPEIALVVRGGAGVAKVARFSPAVGGSGISTTLEGWEACTPVRFSSDEQQSVEVRCKYDPDHLYLRWHARLSTKFQPRAVAAIERMFTHDRLADTLSFYIQGNDKAASAKLPNGRPGDVRFVFGLVPQESGVKPVCLGMYPEWIGAGAQPQVFRTPVGQISFAHVGLIADARLEHAIDKDEKGFVITAAIPRAAIPSVQKSFDGNFRTMVNFEATFGGHNKFWWANSDGSASSETYDEPTEARLYPGSWAPAQFQGLDGGLVVRNWMICGPFGGPGAEKFSNDPNGNVPGKNKSWKDAVAEYYNAAKYPLDSWKVDPSAVFSGDIIQGYWKQIDSVRWKPDSIADLDSRVILGHGSQVWYGATWLHVPEDTHVDIDFLGHPMTTLTWSLNAEPLTFDKSAKPTREDKVGARKTVTLRKGWNQIMFRGFCVGYPPFRAGVNILGPAEKLWTIQMSGTPRE